MVGQLISQLPRIILAGLFCFAGFDKLLHYSKFLSTLESYHILPPTMEGYVAPFIIMAELGICAGLLRRSSVRVAALSAMMVLAGFTLVYVTSPEEACGCWFTLTLATGKPIHIFQNLLFIGLATLAWMGSQKPSSEDKSETLKRTFDSTLSPRKLTGRRKGTQGSTGE